MQSNDARGCALVEVAAYGVANLFAQFGEVLRLHKDGLTEGSGGEADFGGIFDEKDDFGYASLLRCEMKPRVAPTWGDPATALSGCIVLWSAFRGHLDR